MFISKEVTNPSLRAWGSIVVGSPSFAQRKVFASPLAASATSRVSTTHTLSGPSPLVIESPCCNVVLQRQEQFPGQSRNPVFRAEPVSGRRKSKRARGNRSRHFIVTYLSWKLLFPAGTSST